MLDSGLWKIVAVAIHELVIAVASLMLFFRGVGMGSISIPSMSAAYASILRRELPMATIAINTVQRLGVPMQRGGKTC